MEHNGNMSLFNCTSGEGGCYSDKGSPIVTVTEELYLYCHCHSRYIPGMMPAREFPRHCILQHRHALSSVQAGVEESCCCTAPSFNRTLLKKSLKEKFNNPIALKVTEYVAVFQVSVKTKYR